MEENKKINNQPEKEGEKKKRKCGFLVWWHKLSKGAKIGISAAAGVALTSAIVFPTLAVTVWKKGGIEFKIEKNDDMSCYVARNVSLKKDSTYNFSLDMNQIFKGDDDETCFYAFDGEASSNINIKTDEFISSETFKTNLNDIKKVDDEPIGHQYQYSSNYNAFKIGEGTFNKKENIFNCTFKAKESGTTNLLVIWAD